MTGGIFKRKVAAIIAISLLIDDEEEPPTRRKTSHKRDGSRECQVGKMTYSVRKKLHSKKCYYNND